VSALLDELEASLIANRTIRAEVERLAPTLRKLSDDLLVALVIATRHETARRTEPLPRSVGIGNR